MAAVKAAVLQLICSRMFRTIFDDFLEIFLIANTPTWRFWIKNKHRQLFVYGHATVESTTLRLHSFFGFLDTIGTRLDLWCKICLELSSIAISLQLYVAFHQIHCLWWWLCSFVGGGGYVLPTIIAAILDEGLHQLSENRKWNLVIATISRCRIRGTLDAAMVRDLDTVAAD